MLTARYRYPALSEGMRHIDFRGTARRRATLRQSIVAGTAALLAVSASDASALMMGNLELRSHLGERLHARVTVERGTEAIAESCVAVRAQAPAGNGVEPIGRPRVTVERGRTTDVLVIRTLQPVTDPIVGLRVEVTCPSPFAREYTVLLDPRPADLPLAIETPAVAAAAEVPMPGRAAEPAVTPAQPAAARPADPAPPARAPRRKPVATRPADTPDAVPPQRERAARPATRAPRPPATRAARASEPTFVLRVESELPDLSRSTGVTDEQREMLRRTQMLILQGDDQVALLLGMRDRIRLMEAEIKALQARIDSAAAAAQAPAAGAEAPAGTTGSTQPATTTTPGGIAPHIPVPPAASRGIDAHLPWLAATGVAGLFAVAGGIALARRRAAQRERQRALDEAAFVEREVAEPEVADPFAGGVRSLLDEAPSNATAPTFDATIAFTARAEPMPAAAAEVGPVAATPIDFTLASPQPETLPALDVPLELSFDPAPAAAPAAAAHEPAPEVRAAQERYFTDRYGADPAKTVVLRDPEALVKQARIYYLDDGDAFKATDLLELGIAANPQAARPWLALLAVYRRENMAAQYATLARRYAAQFPGSAEWTVVQQLGREMDAGEALYAGTMPVATNDDPFDVTRHPDVTDDWLGVPLDFTSHMLAEELHTRLVKSAGFDAPGPAPSARAA